MSQIAEAADVSESTFFRYFPSKEDVIFLDDADEALVDAFAAQPAELSPIQALRAAIRVAFGEVDEAAVEDARERGALAFSVPELREAMAGRMLREVDQIAALLAPRLGLGPQSLRVRALAGALTGALLAAAMAPGDELADNYVERMDAALAELEGGLSS